MSTMTVGDAVRGEITKRAAWQLWELFEALLREASELDRVSTDLRAAAVIRALALRGIGLTEAIQIAVDPTTTDLSEQVAAVDGRTYCGIVRDADA